MRKQYSRDDVHSCLIQSLHSSRAAEDFFRKHLGDDQLLSTLIEMALEDESDDARMEAAFWVAQFAADLLEPFKEKLEQLSQDDWESVASHARTALDKITSVQTYVTAV